ncbi:hypothetical protein JCM10450v2_003104 [Rhodotorula kratochvilovae]
MAPVDLSSSGLEAYKQQALTDLQQAASNLNARASSLHTRYVAPSTDALARSAHRQPVLAAFLGVFALLAFFPVLTFTLFALGTVLVIGGGALLAATAVIAWIVGAAGLLLVGTLVVVAFLSFIATVWIGGAYALYRFWTILKQADTLPDAIQDFQDEAVALLLPSRAQAGEASSKVRFNGVVKEEGGGDGKLNDLKPVGGTNGSA